MGEHTGSETYLSLPPLEAQDLFSAIFAVLNI